MPIYKGDKEEEKPKEPEAKRSSSISNFRNFMGDAKTKAFVSEWNKKGYTKAGVEELLFEIYQRYGGDGDDDDEDKVRDRTGEMLDIMKSVRKLWEPFKKE